MTRRIGLLGAVLMVLYVVLFAALNVTQLVRAEEYRTHAQNRRGIERDFGQRRGVIQSNDGVPLAVSTATPDGPYDYLRQYPQGDTYAHVVGYISREFGAAGLEQSENDTLSGADRSTNLYSLTDLFVERDPTADLTLTMVDSVQQVAKASLGDRAGSVVALDPRTGEVLAMWSSPSFDPNLLSTHDLEAAEVARTALLADEENPLRARSFRDRFAPGSTFKVVTASAALASGTVTPTSPVYPPASEYVAPGTTRPLRNFGGGTCGGDLADLLRVSCNTGFAQMTVEDVGAALLAETAQAFGFDDTPPFDVPGAVESVFPDAEFLDDNPALLAQSAIGQFDVAATPLEMALVAAGVANDGVIMQPFVIDTVTDSGGEVLDRTEPRPWKQPLSPADAAAMQSMMEAVVTDGTAARAAVPGVRVAAKTGTAQVPGSENNHAWIVAFAPVEAPTVAVAVLVEESEGADDNQTGGRVAAPIAADVMAAALAAAASAPAAPAEP